MSLTIREDEKIQTTVFNRIHHSVKNFIKKYFESPAHNLFYFGLFITLIGLFFGLEFDWEYYALLLLLGLINIFNQYAKRNGDDQDTSGLQETDS